MTSRARSPNCKHPYPLRLQTVRCLGRTDLRHQCPSSLIFIPRDSAVEVQDCQFWRMAKSIDKCWSRMPPSRRGKLRLTNAYCPRSRALLEGEGFQDFGSTLCLSIREIGAGIERSLAATVLLGDGLGAGFTPFVR